MSPRGQRTPEEEERRWPLRAIMGGLGGLGVLFAATLGAMAVFATRPIEARPPVFPTRPRPIVLAHRGGAGEGPESTVPTMLATLARNPSAAIELDVHQSRDGQIVVLHDDTVDRTTNGRGRVVDLTLAELRALDAGYCATPGRGAGTAREHDCRTGAPADFPQRGRGYHIPTLAEVLAALPATTIVAIEIKEPGFEPALAALMQSAGGLDRFIVGSGYDDVARRMNDLLPTVAHYFPRWAGLRFTLAAKLSGGRLARPDYQVLACPRSVLGVHLDTPRLLSIAHRRSVMVAFFTIDDEAEMERLLRLGADALITDYPSRAADAIAQVWPKQ